MTDQSRNQYYLINKHTGYVIASYAHFTFEQLKLINDHMGKITTIIYHDNLYVPGQYVSGYTYSVETLKDEKNAMDSLKYALSQQFGKLDVIANKLNALESKTTQDLKRQSNHTNMITQDQSFRMSALEDTFCQQLKQIEQMEKQINEMKELDLVVENLKKKIECIEKWIVCKDSDTRLTRTQDIIIQIGDLLLGCTDE